MGVRQKLEMKDSEMGPDLGSRMGKKLATVQERFSNLLPEVS